MKARFLLGILFFPSYAFSAAPEFDETLSGSGYVFVRAGTTIELTCAAKNMRGYKV